MTRLLALVLIVAAPAGAAEKAPTPAEERIALAQRAIARNPATAAGYNDLALAFARRARETSDPAFYLKAEEAIAQALAVAPDNLEALKAKTWVLLGKHEFKEARELAKVLNQRVPDDVLVYGYLVDANVELGRYDEAEEAAQWMLNLRPGNIAGLTRAAYLRELFGDVDGALELMGMAFQQTSPAEVEEQAWILTQIAHLQILGGKPELADRLLARALSLFPDYHYALAELAKVRTAQGRPGEAALLLDQRYRSAPHPENLYDLAVALEAAGRTDEARAAFARFEPLARAESAKEDNANRELVFYYVDHASRPEDGLRVAEQEVARRRDVHTLDAYAWALHATGRTDEARRHIEAALAVGVREGAMLRRGEAIRKAAGVSSVGGPGD